MSLAPPKPSPLVPGYRLDRYELLCPVAEGGMASVWVARLQGKHGFEKLVAIKTILPKYAEDVRFQQMFLDEARIASRIEHTNVAQILDLGEEHNVLYLVMEWVDGDALSKLQRAVERKHMTIPTGIVLRALADTCGGLHAAHELRDTDGTMLNVVHRDVSPQNVLVSSRGIAKLIDFGIAKARDRVAADTNAGLLKGKIQYMAPEQALGQAIDRRADIWAIGAIAYHLLAGRPPYEGANQLATLHLLTSGKPPLPLPPTVPPPVVAVVRKALTHDPSKRYATAAEFQAAIESAMHEAKIATTQSDIASFTAEHLADRVEHRKQAIDVAIKAAQERARVARLLKPNSAESSSGVDLPSSSPNVAMRDPEAQLTAPAVPVLRPRPSQPDIEAAMRQAPLSETSTATLGSAALASPLPDVMPETASRKRAVVAGVAAALGVMLVAGIGVGAFAMRGGDQHAATVSSSSTTAAAATSSAPIASSSAAPSASTPPEGSAIASAPTASAAAADSAAPSASPSSHAPPTALPRVGWGMPPANVNPAAPPTASAAAPAGSQKAPVPKKKVDDGF